MRAFDAGWDNRPFTFKYEGEQAAWEWGRTAHEEQISEMMAIDAQLVRYAQ